MYYIFFIILISVIIYSIIYKLTKDHKNLKKRKLTKEYYTKTVINLLVSVTFVVMFFSIYSFSNRFLPKLKNIIYCLLIIDTIYYWTHRIIHRTPFLKNIFHSTHHECSKLIPLDMYYISYKENMISHG